MAEPPITDQEIPEAVVEERKRGPRVSIVWLIPLIAALIGGWLAYRTLTETGPLITISFKTAEGLAAGKTTVKFKDVDVGKVEAIELKDDLSGVVVSVRMNKEAEPYLTDKTRFWVVKAQITAAGVTGLGTLLAGAYIGIDPIRDGKPTRHFVGLEDQPVVTTDVPGRHFRLHTRLGGTMQPGSPVYYKRFKVGEVVSSKLTETGDSVDIGIFVASPYDKFVQENTRFWNASGIDASLSAEGVSLDTESLVTVLIGGVAFDLPPDSPEGEPAKEDTDFELFANRTAAFAETYAVKHQWKLYFNESVRGLTVGAPVEFRGIPMGRVTDLKLVYDSERHEARIPVTIEIEPRRMADVADLSPAESQRRLDDWVARGLRARLDSGSLITGQLLVALDFFPDAPEGKVDWEADPPVFPTIPSAKEQLLASVEKVANGLASVPFEEIGVQAKAAVESLNQTLKRTDAVVAKLDGELVPAVTAAIKQARGALAAAENTLAADSPLREDLNKTLQEVSQAARSLKVLLDYLEQHPEALIRGKPKPTGE